MKYAEGIMKNAMLTAAAAMLCGACNRGGMEHDAMGVFEATEVTVSAKAQGEIISLGIEEGDTVRPGDTLGAIDVRQLALHRQQLGESRTASDAARLNLRRQLAALRQQVANARREKERLAQMLAAGAATQQQADAAADLAAVLERQAEALAEQVGNQNRAAESAARGIGVQMEATEVQMDDAVIRSPIAGTVLQKFAERGEYAVPGKPIFEVADLRRMVLRAYVTADQYNRLRLGQRVRVYVDGCAEPYAGTLAWISPKAEFTPKTIQTRDERANLVYAVKVRVANDGRIKIGMYGEVDFDYGRYGRD